jgi:hypothetical protein
MSINIPELSFAVAYKDEQLIQIEVTASNGRYAGVTTFYTNSDGQELINFSKKLQGFPQNIDQEIMQEFGFTQEELKVFEKESSGLKTISSYVGLTFFCIGKLGHAAISIKLIEDNWSEREEARGKVSFELQFDPASLDLFVQELTALGETKTEKATLLGKNIDQTMYF